jgi:predicted metal-dependent phosphoesterase TrpH
MKEVRFLFHLHTRYSYDATLGFEALYACIEQFKITHLAITEHNHLESFSLFQSFLDSKKSDCVLVPACEYSTAVGDIIVLGTAELIRYEDPMELLQKAKSLGAVSVLPHPFKRGGYPADVLQAIDIVEIMNMRAPQKTFDPSILKGKGVIYGSDIHHRIDLPGVLNVYRSEASFTEMLVHEMPLPMLPGHYGAWRRKISRLLCKLRKKGVFVSV